MRFTINTAAKGYILSDGTLTSYELIELKILPSTRVSYKCLIGGREVFLNDIPRTYSDEDAFRRGEPDGLIETDVKDLLWKVSMIHVNPDGEGRHMVFTYRDGKVRYMDGREIVFTLSGGKWSSNYACYNSEKELRRWHDVTVTENDGSTREIRSMAGLVAIKSEQEVAVRKLTEAIKEAADSGIKIIADWESYDVYVMDTRGISKLELLYGEDPDDERKDIIDMRMMRRIARIDVINSNNDCYAALPFRDEPGNKNE